MYPNVRSPGWDALPWLCYGSHATGNMDMAGKGLDGAHSGVLAGAEQVRAVYAQRFADDLEGQWSAWFHVTIRREATLHRIQRQVQRRSAWSQMALPARAVAREVLDLIVKRHDLRALERLLARQPFKDRAFTADLMIWIAAHENDLLSPLEQTASIEKRSAALFSICATLAAIVRQAYLQLETLSGVLADRSAGHGICWLWQQFQTRAVEHKFHEQVFHEMARWVTLSPTDRGGSRRACAERLAGLLPREVGETCAGESGVSTDGGLAKLFARYRVPIGSPHANGSGRLTRRA